MSKSKYGEGKRYEEVTVTRADGTTFTRKQEVGSDRSSKGGQVTDGQRQNAATAGNTVAAGSHVGAAAGWNEDALDDFYASYVEAALWSSLNEDSEEHEFMDGEYGIEDIHPDAEEKMRADCEAFIQAAGADLSEWDPSQAGHDFWLTRGGHGTGFSDRGKESGDVLTEHTKAFRELNMVVGDDKKLHAE